MKPGIYHDLPAEEYFAAPGLSHSAMKDLAVSPMRFWHRHLSPDRPKIEPTAAMQFGSALHCAILEPDRFNDRYACEIDAADYPGCLVKADDLKGWLKERGVTPKGTTKTGWTEQIHAIDPDVPIFDVIERRHFGQNDGKVMISKPDYARLSGATQAAMAVPEMAAMLSGGDSEVSIFAIDPETGVLVKCRCDWFAPTLTMDLKSFTQSRGKSIDQSVADAIFYEGYYRQSWHYNRTRFLATGKPSKFIFSFVESDAPHEVRLKRMQAGQLYHDRARVEVTGLIRLYAECREKFGNDPWIDDQGVTDLVDEDIPALAY